MVDPVSRPSSNVPSSFEKGNVTETKKALQTLQNMEVMLSFVSVWKETKSLSSSDASSEQGQIQNVIDKLEKGSISIEKAVLEISSIIQKFEKLHKLTFPALQFGDPNNSVERVAEQVFAFQSFVKPLAEKEGELTGMIKDLTQLADNIEKKTFPPEEGLAQLIGKISEVNETLPTNLHYPIPETSAYFT